MTVNQLVVGSIPTLGASYGDVAQLGERLLCKQNVAGSIPVISTSIALLAQLVEQRISNAKVGSSSLSRGTS